VITWALDVHDRGVQTDHMNADQPYERPLPRPVVDERELRTKACELRAVAQSALASGRADGAIKEHLVSVVALTGMYVRD
jgi:hypothetical protein